MRIMQISALYPPYVIGGAELSSALLAEGLAELGDEVHTLTLAPPQKLRTREPVETGGRTIQRLPLRNLYWPYSKAVRKPGPLYRALWHILDTHNPLMVRQVEQAIRRLRPDVLVTHNLQGFSTAVIPAAATRGIPVVHVLHDYALLCPRTILFRGNKDCGHRDERCRDCRLLTAPRWRHVEPLSGVIGVSAAVLRAHHEHGLFRGTFSTVIPNALPAHLQPLERVPARPAGRTFHFGYLARVEFSKGIEALLAAASTLAQAGHRFRISVAGRGDADYIESLRRRWPLAEVEYVGFVAVPEFLASLDALVFPVIALEALGNVVFEAYSRGLPVIASSRGGITEHVVHGETGFLTRPGDIEALSAYMAQILTDPDLHLRMAEAALRKSRGYSARRRTETYRSFLQEVVRRSGRPLNPRTVAAPSQYAPVRAVSLDNFKEGIR